MEKKSLNISKADLRHVERKFKSNLPNELKTIVNKENIFFPPKRIEETVLLSLGYKSIKDFLFDFNNNPEKIIKKKSMVKSSF
jgi:hypothetical protein